MQPHVLALQEIGTQPSLEALQGVLSRQMPHLALGVPDSRGIRCALLSTLELTDQVDIRPLPSGLLPVQCGDDPPGAEGPRR